MTSRLTVPHGMKEMATIYLDVRYLSFYPVLLFSLDDFKEKINFVCITFLEWDFKEFLFLLQVAPGSWMKMNAMVVVK